LAAVVEGVVVVVQGAMMRSDVIVCEECGRALAGIVALIVHYLNRHPL